MTTGRINQVSCHETFSGEVRRLAVRFVLTVQSSTEPKCIGISIQLIIVLSRFQSPLQSANKLANSSVERIHLYEWDSVSNAQAQGHVMLHCYLSRQQAVSYLGLLLLPTRDR